MKIIDRAVTIDGIDIQLEDWHNENTEEHPALYGFTIAAYPKAKNADKFGWIKINERFRLSISRNEYQGYRDKFVIEDYAELKRGTKTLADLKNHFDNGDKDKFYLGLINELSMKE